MTDAAATADALLAEGRRRYEAGDYADAEPLAERALELLPVGGDPLARAIAVQLAGECAYSLGHYREARALADEAAALRAGASDADVAESRNLQGIVDIALGDTDGGYERVAGALTPARSASSGGRWTSWRRAYGDRHPFVLKETRAAGQHLGCDGRQGRPRDATCSGSGRRSRARRPAGWRRTYGTSWTSGCGRSTAGRDCPEGGR